MGVFGFGGLGLRGPSLGIRALGFYPGSIRALQGLENAFGAFGRRFGF